MEFDETKVMVKIAYGQWIECSIGGTVVRGNIEKIEVPPFYRARIFRGASLGGRDKTSIFHAGIYWDAWLYGNWVQRHGPKFIEISATEMEPHQLLTCEWREKARDGKWRIGYQRFEPGEYDVTKGDFRNDVFEKVIIPQDAQASLWEHSGQSGRFVKFDRAGERNLQENDLSHRISSLVFKHDEWKEVNQRLGDSSKRREIGNPIIVPFSGSGLPGAIIHPFVNLGRSRESETNWHVDQRIGISATVGTGEGAPVKAEFTVSSETETGGGGSKTKGYTEQSGISVDAAADSEGIVSGFIRAQLLEAQVQIFRTLQNVRTKEEYDQEGDVTGTLYSYEVHFERGAAV